ncbi:8359_t:CDS:2, partial [Funneliformis caledonium]
MINILNLQDLITAEKFIYINNEILIEPLTDEKIIAVVASSPENNNIKEANELEINIIINKEALNSLEKVKEYDDNNGNRCQRLDILIKDDQWMEAFSFELIVRISRKVYDEHCEHSKKYAQLYQCSMLIVNICTNKKLINYFGSDYENVTTVHVVYDESKGCAELVYKDGK